MSTLADQNAKKAPELSGYGDYRMMNARNRNSLDDWMGCFTSIKSIGKNPFEELLVIARLRRIIGKNNFTIGQVILAKSKDVENDCWRVVYRETAIQMMYESANCFKHYKEILESKMLLTSRAEVTWIEIVKIADNIEALLYICNWIKNDNNEEAQKRYEEIINENLPNNINLTSDEWQKVREASRDNSFLHKLAVFNISELQQVE